MVHRDRLHRDVLALGNRRDGDRCACRDIHHGKTVIGVAVHSYDGLIVSGGELSIVGDLIHGGSILSNQKLSRRLKRGVVFCCRLDAIGLKKIINRCHGR